MLPADTPGARTHAVADAPLTSIPSQSLTPPAPTWEILRQHLQERITAGAYPIGSWLPSVRELAAQIGLNRNTVSKVYQALGRDGILEVVRGKGVRVVAKPTQSQSAASRIDAGLAELVKQASLAGLGREWLVDRMGAAIDSTIGSRALRIGFIECSPADTSELAESLAGHLGIPVVPIDLTAFEREPERLTRDLDLLTTTLFHLQEIDALLPAIRPKLEAIHHTVSHVSLLKIAQLKAGTAIVIVCPNQRTVGRFQGIVQTYSAGPVRAFTIDDDEAAIADALAAADLAVDISTTHDLVTRLAPQIPTVTLTFHVEPQSIEELREVVHELSSRASRSSGSGDRTDQQA
jgi:GntR family transcriptional regulator